jgi:hypothetical protein
MNVYNPTISDRSYRPKVDDKTWYSAENFEIFTKMYGCKRGFYLLSPIAHENANYLDLFSFTAILLYKI